MWLGLRVRREEGQNGEVKLRHVMGGGCPSSHNLIPLLCFCLGKLWVEPSSAYRLGEREAGGGGVNTARSGNRPLAGSGGGADRRGRKLSEK